MRTLRPGVVLLDLDLGDLGDGVELVQPLTELGARVLVVSGTTDRLRLAETVERGAVGFLSKQVPFEQLLSTVLDVVAQRPVLSTARRYELMAELRSARAARSKDLAPFKTLTPRERVVLAALAQGPAGRDHCRGCSGVGGDGAQPDPWRAGQARRQLPARSGGPGVDGGLVSRCATVIQHELINNRGPSSSVLMMSATAAPRIILYGGSTRTRCSPYLASREDPTWHVPASF